LSWNKIYISKQTELELFESFMLQRKCQTPSSIFGAARSGQVLKHGLTWFGLVSFDWSGLV